MSFLNVVWPSSRFCTKFGIESGTPEKGVLDGANQNRHSKGAIEAQSREERVKALMRRLSRRSKYSRRQTFRKPPLLIARDQDPCALGKRNPPKSGWRYWSRKQRKSGKSSSEKPANPGEPARLSGAGRGGDPRGEPLTSLPGSPRTPLWGYSKMTVLRILGKNRMTRKPNLLKIGNHRVRRKAKV
jgi:hypothetical protein